MGLDFYILSGLLSLACYLTIFLRKIKNEGLDPSLITYSSPLLLKGYAGQRVFLFLAVFLRLIIPDLGIFILSFVFFCSLFLCLVLILFGRQQTQPLYSYILIALVCLVLLINHGALSYLVAGSLLIAQELSLYLWQKSQARRYNDWVFYKALKLNNKYLQTLKLDPNERLWVLHIATTEDIARPAIVRLAERFYFKLCKPNQISTGIMQVKSNRPVSDKESFEIGREIISNLLAKMPPSLTAQQQMLWISRAYNDSDSYASLLAATRPGVIKALK